MDKLKSFNSLNFQKTYTFPCYLEPRSVATIIRTRIGGKEKEIKPELIVVDISNIRDETK